MVNKNESWGAGVFNGFVQCALYLSRAGLEKARKHRTLAVCRIEHDVLALHLSFDNKERTLCFSPMEIPKAYLLLLKKFLCSLVSSDRSAGLWFLHGAIYNHGGNPIFSVLTKCLLNAVGLGAKEYTAVPRGIERAFMKFHVGRLDRSTHYSKHRVAPENGIPHVKLCPSLFVTPNKT